jgi:tRNA pseudouridine55 synthase
MAQTDTWLARMTIPMFHGLLVLDKPVGITSRAALDRIAGLFPRSTRIGHTGTLDPLATGVLVLCIGSATRLAEYVQDMAKTYQTTLVLGARSDTDDAEGPIMQVSGADAPDWTAVERALECFLGDIDQVPPAFSAAKVTGRRAYALARKGCEVVLPPRRVHIAALEVLDYAFPRLCLEIHCGKGTYIRSLARDLGEQLGCGAYVDTLRRTRVGPFTTSNAIALEADAETARAHLMPVSAAVSELPRLTLTPDEAVSIRHGKAIPLSSGDSRDDLPEDMMNAALFDAEGNLIAVARLDRKQGLVSPEKVFPANDPGLIRTD